LRLSKRTRPDLEQSARVLPVVATGSFFASTSKKYIGCKVPYVLTHKTLLFVADFNFLTHKSFTYVAVYAG